MSMPESLNNGRYIRMKPIGNPGMSGVYLAKDTRVRDRLVVVKLVQIAKDMLEKNQAQQAALGNFKREVDILASERYDRIVIIYDCEIEEQGNDVLAYIVMPYCKEEALQDWFIKHLVEKGPLQLADVATLLDQAGDALQHLHDRGIIHRDIKSTNFLVASLPDPPALPNLWLTDFGLAQLVEENKIQGPLGTDLYMAPEQWREERLTPKTDQYQLAIMAYYLLTGMHPFDVNRTQLSRKEQRSQLQHQHLNVKPPVPSTHRPSDIHPEVDAVILRALEKGPDDRYNTIKDFTNAFGLACRLGQSENAPVSVGNVPSTPVTGSLLGQPPLPPQVPNVTLTAPVGNVPSTPAAGPLLGQPPLPQQMPNTTPDVPVGVVPTTPAAGPLLGQPPLPQQMPNTTPDVPVGTVPTTPAAGPLLGQRPTNRERTGPRWWVIAVLIAALPIIVPLLFFVGPFSHNPTPNSHPTPTPTPITSNCTSNSTLSPHSQSGSSISNPNPFVNAPGIKESMTDACGNVIGLSAGATIFDTTSKDDAAMQKAAAALRDGDTSGALSYFHTVTTTDSSNAEAWIYAENLRVFSTTNNYIAVVLGVTTGRIGSFRDSMQGAYLAQRAYNQSALQRNLPSLVWIIANSGANPANTKWVAQQILALNKGNSHIVGVVGWTISSDSVNANAILAHQQSEHENVFMLSPSAITKDLSGSLHFLRIVLSDVDQVDYMANYAYDKLKYRKIAVIYTPEDNSTSSLYQSFKDVFAKKNGAKVVSEQPFSQRDEASLHSALSRALESNPDGIFYAGFAADAGLLLSSPRIASLPREFKILGGSALAVLSDYSPHPQNLDRLVFISNASQDETSRYQTQLPSVRKFLEDYQNIFPSGTLNTNVMLTYDAVNVFLEGYRMVLANGETSTCLPCALQKALQSMNGEKAWQGVSGQIAFDSRSTEPIDKVILINVIENGTTKTIDYRGCFLISKTDCRN